MDILVGAGHKLEDFKDSLGKCGYEFRQVASTKDRLFFRKDIPSPIKTRIHIHVVKKGGKDFNQMIKFRDSLRNSPKLREEYAQLKKKAIEISNGDGKRYRKLKEKFIQKHS